MKIRVAQNSSEVIDCTSGYDGFFFKANEGSRLGTCLFEDEGEGMVIIIDNPPQVITLPMSSSSFSELAKEIMSYTPIANVVIIKKVINMLIEFGEA